MVVLAVPVVSGMPLPVTPGAPVDAQTVANVGRIIRSARAVRVIRLPPGDDTMTGDGSAGSSAALSGWLVKPAVGWVFLAELGWLGLVGSAGSDFIDSEYLFIVMDILRHQGKDDNWLQQTGYRMGKDEDGNAIYNQVLEGTVVWQYLTALHWSLTQFTPAGMDVFARNVGERIMSVIVLGFAVIIFSSVLASVSASMTALRNLQGDTKKQFWLLRRYLTKKKVTQLSRVRIIKFLEHVTMLQAKTVKMGDVKLLKRLSKPLTELLAYEMHKETARVPAVSQQCPMAAADMTQSMGEIISCDEILEVMTYPFLRYVGGVLQSVLVARKLLGGRVATGERTFLASWKNYNSEDEPSQRHVGSAGSYVAGRSCGRRSGEEERKARKERRKERKAKRRTYGGEKEEQRDGA
eukprot:Skav231989  [mRNA]  locus=scaffold719:293982:302173:- [translate_table: standard]